MLRSRANAVVSVRRVTEVNAGRMTAGIDGRLALWPQVKAAMAEWMQHQATPWTPRPVKRVYISKANGRRRPLGIPVIADRCLQALAVNALEPEWEARFEPRSYGFRPGRGCHDAIAVIYNTASGKTAKRLWVLDADLEAAFDQLDHTHLLAALGTFPGRGMVAGWLRAGVVEQGRLTPTERGSPQGGVISPLLMNIALHGMEEAAGVRYYAGAPTKETARGCPVLVRYADDLLVLCHTLAQAEQVQARLATWLAPRGLAFNADKTAIRHLDTQGCDFLGFSIRRYRGKLLIKPSPAAMRRIRTRLSTEMRALRGGNAAAVITTLNPIIRGWAAYYRSVVSSKAFAALDDHMWRQLYKWASHAHPNKPKYWVTARYFGRFHPSRQDHWVFGDRDSGAYLAKFSWAKIVRHTLVNADASPDNPALAEYWATRRRRNPPPLDRATLRMLIAQLGRCTHCRGLLLHADQEPRDLPEWEQWFKVVRKAIRRQAILTDIDPDPDDNAAPRLVHAHCQPRAQQLRPDKPSGLA